MCLLLYVVFAWLGSYTHHGEKLPVPDISGKTISEAKKILEDNNMRYLVEDSVFVEKVLPGMVVSQIPKPFYIDPETGEKTATKVKENRTIYLTINKLRPPEVSFPKLIGVSKRIAMAKLNALGMNTELKYKTVSYCDGCVVDQLYNGRTLKEGEKIERGSKVTLVVGKTSSKMVNVPDLVGLTVINAKHKLNGRSLNLGLISGECEGCKTGYDTLNAYVVRQSPAYKNSAKQGEEINLIISTEEPVPTD